VYQKELLRGSTETLLLAVVAEKPMYGYQLVKEIQRRSNGYFQFKEGTLYPALHRLENAGLIFGAWASATSGQPRRYYSITEAGLRHLSTKSEEWRSFAHAVHSVLQPATG